MILDIFALIFHIYKKEMGGINVILIIIFNGRGKEVIWLDCGLISL